MSCGLNGSTTAWSRRERPEGDRRAAGRAGPGIAVAAEDVACAASKADSSDGSSLDRGPGAVGKSCGVVSARK